jgi:hypothetical protein
MAVNSKKRRTALSKAAMGADKLEELRGDEYLGAGDETVETPDESLKHPWGKQLKLPSGMYCTRPNAAVVMPLHQVMTGGIEGSGEGKIVIPEKVQRTACWFMICYPGDVSDPQEVRGQDLILNSSDQGFSQDEEIVLGPGDMIAASDFDIWPVDVDKKRWRIVPGANVVLVVKRGSLQYQEMMGLYAPHTTEKDSDVDM